MSLGTTIHLNQANCVELVKLLPFGINYLEPVDVADSLLSFGINSIKTTWSLQILSNKNRIKQYSSYTFYFQSCFPSSLFSFRLFFAFRLLLCFLLKFIVFFHTWIHHFKKSLNSLRSPHTFSGTFLSNNICDFFLFL